MAQFVLDTFTGTNSTPLTSRSGETGATWTFRRGSNIYVIYSGKLDGGGANSLYTSSGTPGGANYSVTANLNFKDTDNQGNGARVYVAGRLGGTNTSQGYYAGWTNVGTAQWELWKDTVGDGSITSLGTWTGDTGLAGNNRKVELRMDGSSISLYVNDVLRVGPITDTSYSSAGLVGVVGRGSNPQSGLYGVDLLDVEANDLAAGDTQAPTVPGGVTAIGASESSITTSCDATTDNGGGSVAGYKVRLYDNSNAVLSTVDKGNTRTHTFTGLSAFKPYKVAWAAYDNSANESAYSAPFSVSTTLTQSGAIGLLGSLGVVGAIVAQGQFWRVPTNAQAGTPVHVTVFSGSSPIYSILSQGVATVTGGYARIPAATGAPGDKAFAFVHNYGDNTATTSINGGPCVATRFQG